MRRIAFFCLSAVALVLLSGVAYFGFLQATGNFHAVVAGELYRSAQPSAADIRKYAHEEGIRTILNLRGPNPGVDWYEAETKQAHDLGITVIDIPLFSRKKMTDAQEKELLDAMRDAPKPMLVHCASGANRTGMASALYLGIIKNQDLKKARAQLSPYYGHLPYTFLRSYPMRQSMERAFLRAGKIPGSASKSDTAAISE